MTHLTDRLAAYGVTVADPEWAANRANRCSPSDEDPMMSVSGRPIDDWHPDSIKWERAHAPLMCRGCPSRRDCLLAALADDGPQHGVAGGLPHTVRVDLIRKKDTVRVLALIATYAAEDAAEAMARRAVG